MCMKTFFYIFKWRKVTIIFFNLSLFLSFSRQRDEMSIIEQMPSNKLFIQTHDWQATYSTHPSKFTCYIVVHTHTHNHLYCRHRECQWWNEITHPTQENLMKWECAPKTKNLSFRLSRAAGTRATTESFDVKLFFFHYSRGVKKWRVGRNRYNFHFLLDAYDELCKLSGNYLNALTHRRKWRTAALVMLYMKFRMTSACQFIFHLH